MDTGGAGKPKTPDGTQHKPRTHHGGGKKGGKGDRRGGRRSMDTDEQTSEPKSPVYKYEPESGDIKQQNGSKSSDKKEESMDGVG